MKVKFLLASITTLMGLYGLAQEPGESKEGIERSLETYQRQNFSERVFLHIDKSKVIPGETLWYNAYLVQGPLHFFSRQSEVLHVDLINFYNEIIVSNTHKIENGIGSGTITFPTSAPYGDYVLRAYTNWMRNFDDEFFFSEEIEVVLTSNDDLSISNNQVIDLSFFPEGGQLINGLNGRVAFKAVGNGGKGISEIVEGQIVDSKGNAVTFFKSFYKGMGTFFLKPKKGESYKAVLSDGSFFMLPIAVDQGYSVIVNKDQNSIKLTVNSSSDYVGKNVQLIGTLENQVVFNGTYYNQTGRLELAIPTLGLPKGILTLSLLDETKALRSKRHVFIQNKQSLYINTEMKQSREDEQKILMEVSVTDANGNPVSTHLSLAITDLDFIDKQNLEKNLASHLLIESASLEAVERSTPFVMNDDRASMLKADMLMLTHSFKSTDWKEVLNPTDSTRAFKVAKGLTLSGTARWQDGPPIRNKELRAIIFNEESTSQFSTLTNGKGKFTLENFNEDGTVNMIFSAHDKKGKLLPIKVSLDESERDLPVPDYEFPRKTEEVLSDGVSSEQAEPEDQAAYAAFDRDATFLDEVTVVGRRIEEGGAPSVLGIKPSAVRYLDENEVDRRDYLEVLSSIPGVRYTGRGPTANVIIQGNITIGRVGEPPPSPLWVLDGVTISSDVPGRNISPFTNVPSTIANLNPSAVERIEVLKGADAAIFGVRGGAGVILIYTKQGTGASNPKTANLEVSGHTKPKYFDPALADGTNRYTLYWNPKIQTDKNGIANLQFYNFSNAEDIQIDIQGLSSKGLLGVYLETYHVKNLSSE